MTNKFLDFITHLELSKKDVSRMLGVTRRSVDRWLQKPEKFPRRIEIVLEAWVKLKNHGLHWRRELKKVETNER